MLRNHTRVPNCWAGLRFRLNEASYARIAICESPLLQTFLMLTWPACANCSGTTGRSWRSRSYASPRERHWRSLISGSRIAAGRSLLKGSTRHHARIAASHFEPRSRDNVVIASVTGTIRTPCRISDERLAVEEKSDADDSGSCSVYAPARYVVTEASDEEGNHSWTLKV